MTTLPYAMDADSGDGPDAHIPVSEDLLFQDRFRAWLQVHAYMPSTWPADLRALALTHKDDA